MATEILGLIEIASNLAQEEVPHNEALRQIEGRFGVKSRTTATPPASPANGDTYIVPATGTSGAFVGEENKLAHYFGQAWTFYTPVQRAPIVYVEDSAEHVFWNGTAWTVFSGGGGGGGADEKVKISSTDTTTDYLLNKLQAGVNVTLTQVNAGTNEKINIDATAASGSTYSAPFRGALLQLSASQAITGDDTWQAVAWGAEQFDTDSFWSAGSPTIFTIPAGMTRAQLRAAAYLDDSNGWPLEMAIRNLTTGVDVAYAHAPGSSPTSMEVETPVMSVTEGHTYAVRFRSTADRTLSSGVLTWFAIEVIELQEATAPDGKLLVSSNDTTRGYLNGKLVAGSNITLTEGNDGGNETLTIALDAQPHIVALFLPGLPAAEATVAVHYVTVAFSLPASLTGSRGGAEVAATAETVFSLRKNGTEFGTATVAASGTTVSFAAASETVFAIGDKLSVISPAQDDTLADLGISLRGSR